MPLTRVSLRWGKPATYRQAILDGIYRAMREAFDVPEEDRFMTITEHDAPVFDAAKPSQVRALAVARVDPELLGWSYDFVGDLAETVALIWPEAPGVQAPVPSLGGIVEKLKDNPGLRPEDVFINLVEVARENWSFGNGIAQYAPDKT